MLIILNQKSSVSSSEYIMYQVHFTISSIRYVFLPPSSLITHPIGRNLPYLPYLALLPKLKTAPKHYTKKY